MTRTFPFPIIFTFFLVINISTSLQAQSDERKAYEKEKNGPHGDCDTEWQRLDSGLHYRAIKCLGGDETDMHVLKVDTEKWELNTSLSRKAYAKEVVDEKDAAFAMNANFFGKDREALGVVVRSGRQVHPPRKSSWQSIFLVRDDGKAKIVLPSEWSEEKDSAVMAVQAGPRLVIAGHTNRVHQSYEAARCGVCIQKSGKVLLFATPSSRRFDMYEIARIARRSEEDGGLACRDAMLFDGGHSTQLFLRTEEKDLSISGDAVPVHIYGKRK